jgi:MFS family permease
LNISDDQMGLILGAFWLAFALFEIPGGWMGDRFGARITLTRIVLVWRSHHGRFPLSGLLSPTKPALAPTL